MAFSHDPISGPRKLRALQRRCFEPHPHAASAPTVLDAVRLPPIPGIYTSLPEARPLRGRKPRLSGLVHGTRDSLLDDPTAPVFTNASALPSGPAGWDVHITFPASDDTRAI